MGKISNNSGLYRYWLYTTGVSERVCVEQGTGEDCLILYIERHPIGSLLAWSTESTGAVYRGDVQIPAGRHVRLLLDGQQRMTTIYGVVRGKPPIFDGNPDVLEGLMFHLGREVFEYYQKLKMQDDPLWISVTELMKRHETFIDDFSVRLSEMGLPFREINGYIQKAINLQNILYTELHVQEISGQDKTLDVVVEIFNKVNSGGTNSPRVI